VLPVVTLRAYADYNHFPVNQERMRSGIGVFSQGRAFSGGATSIFTLSANLKVDLAPMEMPAWPYLFMGASYFRVKTSDITFAYPYQGSPDKLIGSHDTALGMNFGGGVEIRLGRRLTVFAEGGLGIGFTEVEHTQYFPLKVGITFQ
jgi:opacity protein-like surface antigen